MSVDAAILSRHSKDLIVPECKDGSTWFSNHLRLDYWVLRRSWKRPAMIGYEIKSSRQDWLKDQKWQDYLPLCNELWFIADPKHIQPGELPEGVGHLRLAGSRLVTVRRATWREIEPPVELMTYILMCRTTIDAPRQPQTADQWRAWLDQREEERRIGWSVAKALREKYERDVEAVRSKNSSLQAAVEQLASFKGALEARGIKWNYYTRPESIVEQIDVPVMSVNEIRKARDALNELLNGTAP